MYNIQCSSSLADKELNHTPQSTIYLAHHHQEVHVRARDGVIAGVCKPVSGRIWQARRMTQTTPPHYLLADLVGQQAFLLQCVYM